MSWFNVWDGLKNKTCRYLLQRYLGQFLDEKLNLEQLNIELYNGKATVKNVSLRVEALNELLDAQGWPFEFTDGQIGLLTVSVPWNALMTNDSSIEASDVVLCLRPVKRAHEGHESMIESMWSSVSSSLQMAEECMRQEEDEHSNCTATNSGAQSGSIVGLEKFAETIDNVLNRIHAKFSNITFKIEYPCHYRLKGVALKIHLNELCYKNETGKEKMPQMSNAESGTQSDQLNRLPTYAKHSVNLTGVSMFTQENWMSENEAVVQHENIPILQFMGQQNVQIKAKQSEEITGPKIGFDVELGSICAFFSPRQLQLLTHFLEAFSEQETYNKGSKQRNEATGLTNFETQQEQQERYSSNLAHGNLNMWNCGPSNVTNIKPTTSNLNFYRNCENYCDSIASSSLSSSTITSVSRYQRKSANIDSCAEISNFVIKISALVGVVLHEDILVETNLNSFQHFWNERSLKELLKVSQDFFEYTATTPLERDLGSQSLYCNKNHLFLRLNPIVAEGKQNRDKNILQIVCTVSATKVELCEILEEQVTHLLKFDRNKNCFNGYQIKPEFTMNFSSSNSIQGKKNSRTNVDLMLEENVLEFDITIIDRLGSFFAPSPYRNYYRAQSAATEDISGEKTEVSVNCAMADIKLRFPIVDLRPLHDPNRVPWWKQNIRSDYILLRFSDFKLIFCQSLIKLMASQIEIFYAETDDVQNHLLSISFDKQQKPQIEHYPQIIVDFGERNNVFAETGAEPKLPFSSKRHCRQNSSSAYTNKTGTDLMENILLPGEKQEIDEFCESTMANSDIQVKLNFPVVDFFVESKQLYELIYNRLNSDLFMWEPSCPYLTKSSAINVQQQMDQSLMNMGLMDSVYISAIAQNDALSDPPYEQQTYSLGDTSRPLNLEQSDQSDDNQDDEDIEANDGHMQQPPQNFAAKLPNHHCSVEIKLGKVTGSCFVPVRDNEKHILPQVCGKFLLNLENVKIFLVAGFGNDKNLSYLSTQIRSGEIYHCGIVPMNTPLRFNHQAQVEDYMQSTIYKIPQGLAKGIAVSEGENKSECDMFSLVIEIKKNPVQRIKRIKITAGIRYTTLRYHPSSASLYWLNQLIDFLDVVDYPIEGYKPYSVLSEMQLHLWDCVIDFRPENFSYRAVLELFYFSVCSNIIPSMPCCNLRFVLEECVLSLAPYEESNHKRYPSSMISFIDAKNLIPVLDVGLLDISLRLDDDESDKSPTFDLRCSIYDVHFRTCYDSGSAFAQLIAYMASNSNGSNDGSFKKEQSLQSSLSSESDFFLSQTEQQSSKEVSKKQQERVNILMAEAVQEAPKESHAVHEVDEEPVCEKDELKLFYFPDENSKNVVKNEESPMSELETSSIKKSTAKVANPIKKSVTEETLPIIKAEFGEITEDAALSEDLHNVSSNDEDYCIIADEENILLSNNLASGSIEVCEDPLMIVDNHFCVPSSSINDPLRTPTHFPLPEQRFTLCEMTFTWHLYGGHDFSASSTTSSTKPSTATGEISSNKSGMSETYRQGVFYANESCRLQPIKKPKEKLTWKSIGGSNRNHEVLVEMQFTKVRFSYEIYPRHTSYASRQVLVVNEIEIRDRLQSSEINKFLYNANIKSFSNRRSQHMVMVKAIHVRPNPSQSNNQECSLRISLSPLRVHIDQDTLEFLTDFFTNFGNFCDKDNASQDAQDDVKQSKLAMSKSEVPIMTINEDEHHEIPDAVHDLRARRIVNENISLLIDEQGSPDSRSIKSNNSATMTTQEANNAPIYFREIIFTPDVSIRFDYHGRRVELSKGPIAGLLMGLGQLQCSEIILRKIIYKRGILGFEKVCNYLCKEWLRDIKRNQLPKILSGVGPTYAFLQLFQGIYDLFWLPIEHYQKDGRLIRGLQLGAQSFSARTILAALEITSRIIQILQFTAETAFDMVSSGPSVRQSQKNRRGRKKRHNRPKDIREGVANAYQILKEGINDSATNLIETAAAEHDQKGLTGAVGAVMRQVPQLVVCPAVLATQATTNILGGVKSSLVPEAKLEAKEKWKDDNC